MNEIKFACVRCKRKGDSDYVYTVGLNHTQCYESLTFAYDMYPTVDPHLYDCEEGFLLKDETFVDRYDAMKIAKETDQLLPSYKHTESLQLFSYMIWG